MFLWEEGTEEAADAAIMVEGIVVGGVAIGAVDIHIMDILTTATHTIMIHIFAHLKLHKSLWLIRSENLSPVLTGQQSLYQ